MTQSNLKVAASAEIKIEKGVVSSGLTGRGRGGRYPWHQMEVGDSFQVPSDVSPNSAYGLAREANVSAALAGSGKKFTVRKQADGTYRCWRLA